LKEEDILSKLHAHDFTAIDDMYILYYDDLCRYASRFFYTEAEEIVQDVFLRLMEKKDRLTTLTRVKPFLYRSVLNACVNKNEHNKVQRKYQDETVYLLKQIELEDSDFNIDKTIDDYVKESIKELPPQARRIFKMKYSEGLKYKEIAEKLGISPKTVETHILRGLKNIRNFMKNKGIDNFFCFFIFFYYVGKGILLNYCL